MSGVGVGTSVYDRVDATVEADATVTASSETSVLTATAQIAQYVYDDLRRMVLQHKIPIARDLDFRDYDDDPEDFLCKLFGDIERLLDDGLIASVTFILSDPIAGSDSRYVVRYRVTYRVERDIDPENIGRQGGYLAPPERLIPGAKFSMVADWSAESAGQRADYFTTGRYNFKWIPVNKAIFNDSQLSSQTRSGGFVPTEGELRVMRIEQAQNTR